MHARETKKFWASIGRKLSMVSLYCQATQKAVDADDKDKADRELKLALLKLAEVMEEIRDVGDKYSNLCATALADLVEAQCSRLHEEIDEMS